MVDYVVANDEFGKRLAAALGCGYREFKEVYYPDGEACPQILADYGEIEGAEVIFAPRMRQKPTKETLAIYLHNCQRILGALTEKDLFNAKWVDVLFPYFWLGRQDHNPRTDKDEKVRSRDKGKDIGYRSIARLFRALGARRTITFDPHFYRQEGTIRVCDMEIVSLSGVYSLGRYFADKIHEDTIVLSPDLGASMLSEKLSQLLGLKTVSLTKRRISGTQVESAERYDAKGLDIIFVDDVISTARTLTRAISSLDGAGEITVSCIHAVLPQVGYDRLVELKNSGKIKDIVATDTLESDYSMASTVPDVAKYLLSAR